MLARSRFQLGLVFVVLGAASISLCLLAPPLGGLVQRVLVPLALSVPVTLAAVGAGHAARRLLQRSAPVVRVDPWLVSVAEELTMGLPVFGAACFLIACASTGALPFGAFLLACTVLGMLRVAKLFKMRRETPALGWPPWTTVLVSLCMAAAALVAQLPPSTLDEVAYHLAVPKAWVLAGHVVELPLNSQAYFPNGIESAALPLLALAGDGGAIAFHFVVLASFAAALVIAGAWLRTYDDGVGPWLAVVATATTPALLLIAGTGWIDAPLLGMAVTLVRALEATTMAHADEKTARADVVLAAAAGTLSKYTWAGVLIAAFAAAVLSLWREPRRAWRVLAAGFAGVGLGSLYFVRNLVWTGNPVAPFFAPNAPHVEAFSQGEGFVGRLQQYVYDPTMADESLGVLLPALVLALGFARAQLRPHTFARALGACSVLVLAGLATLGAAARLAIPFLCLAAGPGAAALGSLAGSSQGWREALSWAVGAVAALQLVFAATMLAQYDPLTVSTGHDAIARLRPAYTPARWLDAHLPPGSCTLLLGLQECYWFRHTVRCAGNFDGPRIRAYLEADSPAALRDKLRRDGFTHVAVYHPGLLVGDAPSHGRRAETKTSLPPESAALLRRMLNELAKKLDQGEQTSLFAL